MSAVRLAESNPYQVNSPYRETHAFPFTKNLHFLSVATLMPILGDEAIFVTCIFSPFAMKIVFESKSVPFSFLPIPKA